MAISASSKLGRSAFSDPLANSLFSTKTAAQLFTHPSTHAPTNSPTSAGVEVEAAALVADISILNGTVVADSGTSFKSLIPPWAIAVIVACCVLVPLSGELRAGDVAGGGVWWRAPELVGQEVQGAAQQKQLCTTMCSGPPAVQQLSGRPANSLLICTTAPLVLGNAAPLPPHCSVLPVPPSSPPPCGVCPAAACRAGGGTGLGTEPRQAAQLQPAARGAHRSAHCDGAGRAARQPLSPQQGECGHEQQVAGGSGWAGGGTPGDLVTCTGTRWAGD